MTQSKSKYLSLYVVSVLLFFSGATGLIYEVIWTRILHYVFGNTEMAAATVLATFMGGLALGGALGGKFAERLKRPVLVYGILEALIAFYGLFFTPVLYKLDFIYGMVSSDASGLMLTLLRFGFGVIFMLLPTIAMGATLPVLIHGTVERKKAGHGMAFLYFINTFGAVFGTFISGFALIPKYGLDISVYVAATLGLLVTTAAVALQFTVNPSPRESDDDEVLREERLNLSDTALKYGYKIVLFAAFMAGFISLANEVLWFRLLGIIMDGTIYGFSALLTAFLAGIAGGSLWISYNLDSSETDLWELYVKLQLGALIGALFMLIFIPFIPFLISGYIYGTPKKPGSVFALKFILVFIPVFIPTFFYGASFPLTIRLASVKNKLSKAAGSIYAINTLGSISGSVLTGMVLMPWIKNINSLLVSMIVLGIIPPLTAIFLAGGRKPAEDAVKTKIRLALYLSFLFFALVIIRPNVNVLRLVNSRYSIEDYSGTIGAKVKSIYGSAEDKKNLIFESEGEVTIVTVHKSSDGGYRLRNNGLNESYHATEQPYYAEEIFYLSALPYILHPDAKTGMLIGLGGGGTLDIMSQTGLTYIDVAELEPEVVKASRIMFDNRHHPLDDPKVHLHIDDGRNALLRKMHTEPGFYDIIVSQPSHPWLSGAANLYTVEHFRIVRKNLKKNGIFCQWINLFRMNGKGFKSLMAAFTRAFDDGYVFQVDENSVFLLGINGHMKINPETIEKHFSGKLGKLLKIYQSSPQRIYKMYLYDFATAKKLAERARVNSDHMPVIETVLPWVDHNTMFYVSKLLDKKKLKYGINPNVLTAGSANLEFYEKYIDYLKNDISLDDEDPEVSKDLIRHAEKILSEASTLTEDQKLRLSASLYERIYAYGKALKKLDKLKNPTMDDMTKYIKLKSEKHEYGIASFYGFLAVFPAYAEFYLSEQKNVDPVDAVKMAHFVKNMRKIGFKSLSLSWFIKPVYHAGKFKNLANDVLWNVVADYELSLPNPRKWIVDNALDMGETSPELLKKMLIYYAHRKDYGKIDTITDIIRTSSDPDKEIYDLAMKMKNFGLDEDALNQLEYLYSKPAATLEPATVLREIIELKIRTEHFENLKNLMKKFKEYSPNEDDLKWLNNQIKKLPLKVREHYKKYLLTPSEV